jgi:hypothetical protein
MLLTGDHRNDVELVKYVSDRHRVGIGQIKQQVNDDLAGYYMLSNERVGFSNCGHDPTVTFIGRNGSLRPMRYVERFVV